MKPRSVLSFAVLLAASIALSLTPQKEPEREPKGYPWNQVPNSEERLLQKRLQGGWKLVRLTDPTTPGISSESAVGYVVVSGSYVAVELHIGVRMRSENRLVPAIRTGMHQMRLTGSTMELSSLIGTFVDGDGRARAEPPGQQRTFQFFISSNLLTLTRSDGYQLVLQRMYSSRARFDVYGREIPGEGKEDALDENEEENEEEPEEDEPEAKDEREPRRKP
jgi:hypothetical protein